MHNYMHTKILSLVATQIMRLRDTLLQASWWNVCRHRFVPVVQTALVGDSGSGVDACRQDVLSIHLQIDRSYADLDV